MLRALVFCATAISVVTLQLGCGHPAQPQQRPISTPTPPPIASPKTEADFLKAMLEEARAEKGTDWLKNKESLVKAAELRCMPWRSFPMTRGSLR
jgi:hypothetical protein